VTINIVPARPEHAHPIGSRLREADKHEVWAASRLRPVEAVKLSLSASELTWTLLRGGDPVLMFGVARRSLLDPVGVPWLLATNDILKVKATVLKKSRQYINLMRRDFETLENFVHGENRISIAWLRWCGFIVEPGEPRGPDMEIFHRFWMNGGLYDV